MWIAQPSQSMTTHLRARSATTRAIAPGHALLAALGLVGHVILGAAVLACGDEMTPQAATSSSSLASTTSGSLPEPAAPPVLSPEAAAQLYAALDELASHDRPRDEGPPTDGVWTVHDDAGHVVAEGPMRGGRRDGQWRRYTSDGQLIEEGSYVSDRPIGTWRLWGSDGIELTPVRYHARACTEEPADARPRPPIMICGGAYRSAPPPPPDRMHTLGAGEYRRCVGLARPWLEAEFANGVTRDRFDVIRRAASPELEQLVAEIARAAMERIVAAGRPAERNGDYLLLAGARSALPENGATMRSLEELNWSLHVGGAFARVYVPGGVSASRAARLYRLRVSETSARSFDDNLEIVNAVTAISDARAELTMSLTADAIRVLAGDRYRVGQLQQRRAVFLLSQGDIAAAGAEAEAAARSYDGSCIDCVTGIEPLRAQIARARGDAATADAIEQAVARDAAERAAKVQRDQRLQSVRYQADALAAQHRERDAITLLQASFAEADAFGPALSGGTPWGGTLRWRAAVAYLSLGELDSARALTRQAMAMVPSAHRTVYDDTLADIDAAERARSLP
jgi:hypothetical protein